MSPKEGTQTLGTGSRRTGAALALLAAIAAFAATTFDSRDAAAAQGLAATGAGRFTWPPAETTSFATAGTVRIRWDPGATGVTRWRLRQFLGPADRDGSCTRATLAKGLTLRTAATGADIAGHAAGFCYRYRIWPARADPSAPPAFVSGMLRVLSRWTGGTDLYRKGVFSTQATMRWCVAASVQMMLNISLGRAQHSRAAQLRYIQYARRHDGYPPSVPAKGSDPEGWVAALNHFGDSSSYHWVTSPRFRWAVHSAARRLRLTGKPVGLIVDHSNHAWVMTGFDATADPAISAKFKVTGVYVMGPLYPIRQSGGYDMPPDTRLSLDRLRNFLTRYRDIRGPDNPWERSFVTIQP
jgi:hypothetical protein